MRAIARSKFRDCPPPAGSPRFARGTERSAWGYPASRGEPSVARGGAPLREGNQAARLLLTQATRITLARTLGLLGVSAPERMERSEETGSPPP